MAGRRASEVEGGTVLANVVLQNRNQGRNAEYVVQIVRLSAGLAVRTKWGAIGARPSVKDYPAASAVAAQADYGAKIQAKEARGYRVVDGSASVATTALLTPAEQAEREARMDEQRELARIARREQQMGAMDRAAGAAPPVVVHIVEGEVVYDEV